MTIKVQKKLQNYLILNKYLFSLFGFKNFREFQNSLKSKREGINSNKKFYFTESLQTEKISEEFRQDLELYDENIQHYLQHINKKRDSPIHLKYFQYMAVLLTEIYLDNYFNHFDSFYRKYAKFVVESNKKENKKGIFTYPYPDKKNMRKLVIWAATGSGKTLIMHINILQIQKYFQGDFDNYLLITPNEGLSIQHMKEFALSNIKNKIFERKTTLFNWFGENPIKIIEITKISDKITGQVGKTVLVDAFGNNNIIFVDEGHKGQSKEAKKWKSYREKIVRNKGFTFEYSATFSEITNKDETFNDYASSIVIDYRYKYFHEDGFGKDYNILNLKNPEDYGDEYFTFALLSFYEQLLYYRDNLEKIIPYNFENPLMIFVGTTVSKTQSERSPDVYSICEFLAEFVNNKAIFTKYVENILTGTTGLTDSNDHPLSQYKFDFLKKKLTSKRISFEALYIDMINTLFYAKSSNKLEFIEIKNANGEIGLKFGKKYFGVINIGDPNSFFKLIREKGNILLKIGPKSQFDKSLFHQIEERDSEINFLIGSKKFIEGWNSYRVSSMGLLNIGKKKGTQIIQLFGRGVRLKGYNYFLKRSLALKKINMIPDEIEIPSYLSILETLNIFGLNADYMSKFREGLKENGIEEYEKYILKIKPTFPSTDLYIPRLVKKSFVFSKEVSIIGLNQKIPKIIIDLSSKVEKIDSSQEGIITDTDTIIVENKITKEIINLLDFNKIYLELLKYKELKNYSNIYFTKKDLIEIIQQPKNYSFLGKQELLTLSVTDEIKKVLRIQDYTIQLLKTFVDKTYKFKKFSWQQQNLRYETISESDQAFIPEEYVFIINANTQDLIENIQDFINQLESFIREKSELQDKIYDENSSFEFNKNKIMDFFALNVHLFQPLIYKNKGTDGHELKFIKINPVSLVESERNFIKLLESFIEKESEKYEFDEIYLLRNPSRKGVGFFESKNFYPDFILWIIDKKKDLQIINFIDPKGLIFIKKDDEKLGLYKEIKKIESTLKKGSGLNIQLNSIILSITDFEDLNWGDPKSELLAKNILFLEDGVSCINSIFKISGITKINNIKNEPSDE